MDKEGIEFLKKKIDEEENRRPLRLDGRRCRRKMLGNIA